MTIMKRTSMVQYLLVIPISALIVLFVILYVVPAVSFAQTIGYGSASPATTSSSVSSSPPSCDSLPPSSTLACVGGTAGNTDPVAWWKFDEGSGTTTADSISAITGSLINNPTWVPGKFGTALDFNGTNTYMQTTAPGVSNLNNITISAWIYARSDGNNASGVRRIVSKKSFDGTHAVRFALQLGPSGTLQFNAGYTAGSAIWTSPAGSVPLNQWHQVSATYTFGAIGSQPALYIDGVPQKVSVFTAQIGSTPVPDDQTLYIGDRGDGTRVFDGPIDNLRIYGRTLTVYEISKLYAQENVSTSLSSLPPGQPAPALSKPNIVVIMTDDQDDTGSLDFMPQLQRLLIQQGTRFTNSFVDFSLCCPSRASFLTGQASHNTGIVDIVPPGGGYGVFVPQEGNTLPVWLQSAGYDTAVIGKYLNGYGQLPEGETHIPPGWNTYDLLEQLPGLFYFGYRMNENGVIKSYGSTAADYQTDVLAQKASDYIDSRQLSSKPFFLWLTPHAPHNNGGASDAGPIMQDSPQPAPRYRGLFANQPLPTAPNFNETDVSDKPRHVAMRPLLADSAIARTTANYRGRLVADLSLDDMVAKVVNELQKTGKLDNTIIIYTSDNGWANGQHRYLYGKTEGYDEIIRVPLVMRGSGIPKGEVRAPLVNNLDIVATIEDLAHVIPGHVPDGASLLPLLNNPNIPWRTALFVQGQDVPIGFTQVINPGVAGTGGLFTEVRTNNYLYAEHNSPLFGFEKEFYDLSKDPFELMSRPNDPAYANIVSALSTTLSKLKTCIGKDCWITTPDMPPSLTTGTWVATQQTTYLPTVASNQPAVDPEEANTSGWTRVTTTPTSTPQLSNNTGSFRRNLRYGMSGSDVMALQQFLARDTSLYSEGAVSGYFGQLTKSAVIRFQNRYATEVLTPTGLTQGTGFVGLFTRQKLNQLLGL